MGLCQVLGFKSWMSGLFKETQCKGDHGTALGDCCWSYGYFMACIIKDASRPIDHVSSPYKNQKSRKEVFDYFWVADMENQLSKVYKSNNIHSSRCQKSFSITLRQELLQSSFIYHLSTIHSVSTALKVDVHLRNNSNSWMNAFI